jgi:hypothetical protein
MVSGEWMNELERDDDEWVRKWWMNESLSDDEWVSEW